MSDSSANDHEDGRSSPLHELNFSVRSAIDGTFFQFFGTPQVVSKSVTVVCLLCNDEKAKLVKVNVKSNSNLFVHIKRYHDDVTLKNFKRALDAKREEFSLAYPERARKTRCRRGSNNQSPQTKFEQLLVDYVIHAMIPLQSIDNASFKKIFDFLHIEKAGLRVISRRTLGRRIDDSFSKHVDIIKEMLRPVPYVCTTADIWSGGKKSFMGVTAHWLDNKNERKSVALGCKRFKGSHTYDKIALILNEINNNFDLTHDKIICTVTDNGSNFVKAFRVFGVDVETTSDEPILEADVDEQDVNGEETWASLPDDVVYRLPFHLRCGAHTLALTSTSDVMKAINRHPVLANLHKGSLEKCNILWKMANRPKTAEVIENVIKKSLSRPNDTRWNSLYDSLKQLVNIRASMEELVRALDLQDWQILSEEEYSYIEEYVKCAAPVAEAIDLLQGEKTAYYGSLLPTILALRKRLRSLAGSDLQFCGSIVNAYINSIESRFSKILSFQTPEGKNAAVAALSYPKFKKKWFPCVDQEKQDEMVKYFKRLISEYLAKEARTTTDNALMEIEPPLEDFYDFGGGEMNEPLAPDDDFANKAQSILETYFNDKKNGLESLDNYRSIHEIFKKTNTPLPSSAPVERLFSYASMTNMPKSNRLGDEKFEQRVVLRANATMIPTNLMTDSDGAVSE